MVLVFKVMNSKGIQSLKDNIMILVGEIGENYIILSVLGHTIVSFHNTLTYVYHNVTF